MKAQFIADSTYIFEYNGCRILTDPWIGTAIYGGAWLQYPPPTVSIDDVGPLDYVFISHIHEDHCDAKTIGQLDRNAKIILMDRKPNFVDQFLKRHNFDFKEVINVPVFTKYELAPGFFIEPLDADPGDPLANLINSSMMLHTKNGQSVFFGNDNAPYPDLIEYMSRYDTVLALLPASGGSGYPACFENLTDDEKKSELVRIRRDYYDKFIAAVSGMKPDLFMATAGYHVIAGRNHTVNANMSFLPNPAEAYKEVHDNIAAEAREAIRPIQMAPGETIDLSKPVTRSAETMWARATDPGSWDEEKRTYIESIAAKSSYDHDTYDLPEDLDWRDLFTAASDNVFARMPHGRLKFESNLYVELPTSPTQMVGHVDGAAKTSATLPMDVERQEPYLEVACDETLLYQLLTGEFSWNISDAACFVRYKRIPNTYDKGAFEALNYLCSRGYKT